jgi:hypothetical protein
MWFYDLASLISFIDFRVFLSSLFFPSNQIHPKSTWKVDKLPNFQTMGLNKKIKLELNVGYRYRFIG